VILDAFPLNWTVQAFGLNSAGTWLITFILLAASIGAMLGVGFQHGRPKRRRLLEAVVTAGYLALLGLRTKFLTTVASDSLVTAFFQSALMTASSAGPVLCGSAVLARTRFLKHSRARAAARRAAQVAADARAAQIQASDKLQRHIGSLHYMILPLALRSAAPEGVDNAKWAAELERATRALFTKADRTESELAGPASSRRATPARIVGELLASHPEAASLLAQASHCRVLALSSAATTRQRFAAARAAQLCYDELRHRLDPRSRRTVNFEAGLAVLVVLAVGIFLELLPAALHGFGLGLDWTAAWGSTRGNAIYGSFISIFILALAAGAATLISHMEPASLLAARRRWHRAWTAHEEAIETEQADLDAASVATEAWLGLVRARTTEIATGEDRLVQDTVALGAALLESGRQQHPPSE
jgi:hypothetical protein